MNSAIAINRMALDGKLPEGDQRWYGFNNAFENREIDIIDFADCVYRGHAYTSWHVPSLRCSQNWKQSQFIAVDMDTGDERSSIKHLENNDLVICFGSLIHTTPSHTPDFPRARVVFLLDRPITNPIAYSNACKFMTTLMGGDTVATDPSRFFYGNCNAEIRVLHGAFPVDHLQTLYTRYRIANSMQPAVGQQCVTRNRKASNAHNNTGEDKWQVISDALGKIHPRHIEYRDWVAIIAAVKHELGDSAEALALTERWADGKPGEIERMWRSMRRESGNVSKIGTIIHWAKIGA